MVKALTCYARRVSETVPDIHLPDAERVVLGRGPLTRIRDHSVSREQVSLVANYEDYSVRLEVIGGNPSEVRGSSLSNGKVEALQHKEEVCLLVGSHAFVILFDPPPPEMNNKRKTTEVSSTAVEPPPSKKSKTGDSLLLKTPVFKELTSNNTRTWIAVNDSEAHIMLTEEAKAKGPNAKLAVYDMDNTIICTKSGNVFPKDMNDWQILYPTIPGKLKSILQEGFRIVIYTNQAGVARGKTPLADVTAKIENIFIKRLGLPVTVLASTAKGGYFRKPRSGLWEHFLRQYNGGLVDKEASFYVGDAAGRDKGWKSGKKKDFSSADRLFARNVGLPFFTPEEHFLSERPTKNYTLPEFNPYDFKTPPSLLDPSNAPLERKGETEVVMMVGSQGSGKSFFARSHFPSYVLASNDISGGRDKTLRVMENALSSGKSVILDNTHPEVSTRALYIARAAKSGTRIRCFLMNTRMSQARHNNLFRELKGEEHVKINEILFNQYGNKYQEPEMKEGFEAIVRVNFIPEFNSEEERTLYHSYLLEK